MNITINVEESDKYILEFRTTLYRAQLNNPDFSLSQLCEVVSFDGYNYSIEGDVALFAKQSEKGEKLEFAVKENSTSIYKYDIWYFNIVRPSVKYTNKEDELVMGIFILIGMLILISVLKRFNLF